MEPACGLSAATSANALDVLTTPACCRVLPMVRPESPACTTTWPGAVPGAGRSPCSPVSPATMGFRTCTATKPARRRARPRGAARAARCAVPPRRRRRGHAAGRRLGAAGPSPVVAALGALVARSGASPALGRRSSTASPSRAPRSGPSSVLAPCPAGVSAAGSAVVPSTPAADGVARSSPGRTSRCARSPSSAVWRMSTAAAWSTTARCLRPATPLSRSVRCASTVVSRSSTRRTGTGATSARRAARVVAGPARPPALHARTATGAARRPPRRTARSRTLAAIASLVGAAAEVARQRLHRRGEQPGGVAGREPDADAAHVDPEPHAGCASASATACR